MVHFYRAPYESVQSYFDEVDVHERLQVRSSDELISLVLGLIWAFLHGLNIYGVFWEGLEPIYGFIIHLILTLVLVVVTMTLKTMGRDIRHLYVLVVTSSVAGIFGAAGIVLTSILTLVYKRFSLPFSEWYKAIYPDFSFSHEQQMYESIASGKDESVRHYSVLSFADVMALGTEHQKRRALTRMTDLFHPSFAPVLRHALQDESNTIRVQAASSITRIERQFVETMMALERMEKKNPEDMQLKLGLARYYDSYAFTGVLDQGREHANRSKAIVYYEQYIEAHPEDSDARIELARLLMRMQQHGRVLELFREAKKEGLANKRVTLWLLEAYYDAGDFVELRRLAAQCTHLLEELRDIRPRLVRSIAFWGGVSE
ncbi:MAG: hypothetical protein EAZ74_02345 [Alphaproteobacteria bacterium]|nr:MAG: hypothetical protein EAY76_00240 [Alphaproteobacteria bacterium]TAF15178.1 MAG: hypothetical protein EAZ74_02345 [Alphaproteobacteria bacterium]TAF41505.1 MAG: hypothetical protein EAZ66_01160 [Alphaproteobacteria bacterium]TAF77029.1 MAG: hypothetical protein EAZ52_02600 [Alphaproteobacteria bacterium]